MIHKFKYGNKNIVLDVNSGAIHLVDDVVFDILDSYNPSSCSVFDVSSVGSRYSEKDVLEAISEVDKIYKSGMLFSNDAGVFFSEVKSPIKSMCLNVSHDCQLYCKYCFASHGDFGGKRVLMDENTSKKAIDFLILNSGKRHNLEVDFFGGEPLLNFDVVRDTVEYAKFKGKIFDKNFRFTITTNGIALDDDKIDFINSEMNNVVLSLDGRKKVNDSMRVSRVGIGCYDNVVKNFQNLVKKRGNKEYYVRGTFTRNNLDFSNDVLHLYNLGFKKISMEPVVINEDVNFSLKESDLSRIFEEYDRLRDLVVRMKQTDHEFTFFHFSIDFKNGPCTIKRMKGCGCGNEYVSITPEGDIYPCHQFVGNDTFKMGNVHSNAIDLNKKKSFSIPNILLSDKCKKCWAKFHCGGGCSANNWTFNKDRNVPYEFSCELLKKRLECSMSMICV